MEKIFRKIRTLTVLVFVVLISLIAFLGLYLKNNGMWQNALAKFNLGMELSGFRELHFALDTTEKEEEVYIDKDGKICGRVSDGEDSHTHDDVAVTTEETEDVETTEEHTHEVEGYTVESKVIKANEDSQINIENFELAKKIIQKRLENFNSYEYNIRLDNITGEIVLEVPDNDDVEVKESLVTSKGNLEIIDTQTGVLLLESSHIKNAEILTSTENSSYQLYLRLQYDSQGAEKLKEISRKYTTIKNESGEEEKKYITVNYDDQRLVQTYFGEELTNGEVNIPLGTPTTDREEYQETYKQAEIFRNVLKGKELPLVYTLVSDNFVKSNITDEMINIAKIACAVIVLIISLVFIIKFKCKGFVAAMLSVGYIAILSLIIRYTNVIITLNSAIAFIIAVAINYIFEYKFFKELIIIPSGSIVYKKVLKELYINITPIVIIAIVFTFMANTVISSIGMVLFWGLFMQVIYNTLLLIII